MSKESYNGDNNVNNEEKDSLLEMAEHEYNRLYGEDDAEAEATQQDETDYNEDLPKKPEKEKVSSAADTYVITVACGFVLGILIGFIINRVALCIVTGILLGCALGVYFYYKKHVAVNASSENEAGDLNNGENAVEAEEKEENKEIEESVTEENE